MSVTPANDATPIDDEMVSKLCRTTLEEARQLAMLLPLDARARLALFCNARNHLRERGRVIAGACTEQALHLEAGFAGAMLFAQSTGGADSEDYSPYAVSRRAG